MAQQFLFLKMMIQRFVLSNPWKSSSPWGSKQHLWSSQHRFARTSFRFALSSELPYLKTFLNYKCSTMYVCVVWVLRVNGCGCEGYIVAIRKVWPRKNGARRVWHWQKCKFDIYEGEKKTEMQSKETSRFETLESKSNI